MTVSSAEAPAGDFTALVLAGSRSESDPLATSCGVSRKSLIPIDGVAMVTRVVRALRGARRIGRVIVCGIAPAGFAERSEAAALLHDDAVSVLEGRDSPAASVLHAVESLPGDRLPLLVTTADHPLLTSAMIDAFCANASASGRDAVVGLVDAKLVQEAFPESRRTLLRFREASYCGANLYALLTPLSHAAPRAWMRVEAHRKRPWRLVGELGMGPLVRFLAGRLTLEEAVELASREMGLSVGSVLLPWPDAAIDVDRRRDLELVERILRARN